MRKSSNVLGMAAVVAASFSVASSTARAVTVDGMLTPGEGYSLVSTQTNVTTSQAADGGNPSGPANEATASSTGNFTQLSNAYASITGTGANATLNLFLGGSVAQNADTNIDLALQTNGTGVSSLNGVTINGSAPGAQDGLSDVMFNGFKPNAFIELDLNVDQSGATTAGTYNLGDTAAGSGAGNNYFYTKLGTGMTGSTPAITGTLDNALVNTPIGTGATGDPGFAGASTGLELSIPLSSLGYSDGTSVEVLAFPSVGSDNRTDNQILAPFSYADANGYDYTYYGTTSDEGAGRQFVNSVYDGTGFFTVAGATVPEPASLSLLAFAGMGLLGRRARKN